MKRTRIAIIIFMVFLNSCEKDKDIGKALYSGDEMIGYLQWSESSDKIYFSVETGNYRKNLYGVDINSGDLWRISEITSYYGNKLFEKDGMIYYFSETQGQNIKLYCVNGSGGTPEMIIDSLDSPVFSKKYIAYLRLYSLPDTSYTRTILYDLDRRTERPIESSYNIFPEAISPDGRFLILRSWNSYSYMQLLGVFDTETGEMAFLPNSQSYYYFNFFWNNNKIYALGESMNGISVYNLTDNQKLTYPETLSYGHQYIISPSGNIIAYLVAEEPEMAQGWVGSHYYLHIMKTGESETSIIDMDREYITGYTMVFSPDETRIAYVRDNTDIYVMTLE